MSANSFLSVGSGAPPINPKFFDSYGNSQHELQPEIPNSLVSCCKYLLLPLCHGRGREFESSPPFPFKHLQRTRKNNQVRLSPISAGCAQQDHGCLLFFARSG
jgi:hypothetical protein